LDWCDLMFSFTLQTLNIMSTIEFNQMLLSNKDFLKPFAVTLTHDQDKALDLIQETMYRALVNTKLVLI
jgi:DNA-directed RNA polymerase specialized sigma24 family protein